MKFHEILNDLKNKIYKPVYFLHGEEEYFIDIITDYIADHVLSEADREFNQTILYGKDTNVGTIIDTARRYPMMANYQVVIVREAQVIDKLDELVRYADAPVPSTILVICHKHQAYDSRKTLAKSIQKTGVWFRSDRLYDNQVPAWIESYLKSSNMTITPGAARLLTAHLGNDLTRISMELGKLSISLKPGERIDEAVIEENIGISKDFNVFELQKAMGENDHYRVNLICKHFAANPRSNPLVLTTTLLYQFFAKIMIFHSLKDKSDNKKVAAELSVSPFFVGDYRNAARFFTLERSLRAIKMLREYDLKSKGLNNVSASEGELLREMVFRIMH